MMIRTRSVLISALSMNSMYLLGGYEVCWKFLLTMSVGIMVNQARAYCLNRLACRVSGNTEPAPLSPLRGGIVNRTACAQAYGG